MTVKASHFAPYHVTRGLAGRVGERELELPYLADSALSEGEVAAVEERTEFEKIHSSEIGVEEEIMRLKDEPAGARGPELEINPVWTGALTKSGFL